MVSDRTSRISPLRFERNCQGLVHLPSPIAKTSGQSACFRSGCAPGLQDGISQSSLSRPTDRSGREPAALSIVDSHQHFWSLGAPWFDWPTPDLKPIYRDYAPADLRPHIEAAGVSRTVIVQAAP